MTARKEHFGDIEKIEQVVTNLIVNSIKYGKPNGTTIVGVENYNDTKFIIKIIRKKTRINWNYTTSNWIMERKLSTRKKQFKIKLELRIRHLTFFD